MASERISLHSASHLSLSLCAVMFSAWVGGLTSGLLSISLSILVFVFILLPSYSLRVQLGDIPRLLIFSLALVPLGVMAQTPGATPRTIRVVMDNAYAPYSFQSDEAKLQGILLDQWQAWEKKTGIKAEIHAMNWDEALRRMRAGEFDVIDSIVATAARRDYFDFTAAYATIEASIFFRNDISGISDLASLKGFPVGVKAGDQHIDQLKANGLTTVIVFQNNDAIIEAAKQHKINVFLIDDPSALYLLNKMGIEHEFRHSAPIFRDELRRAVRKGDAATLRTVSEGFAMIQLSELKQIDEKWFGRTINRYGRYLTYAGYAAVVAILLIAGLVGWNRTLRKGILWRTMALSESEQRFRQIAENIHEVFWLTTADLSNTLYISPAYEVVWGRSRESLYREPRSFFATIHSEDRPHVIAIVERDREQGFEVEYRVIRPDGSMRWIRDRGFPIQDESGHVYRVAGIAEDITERKQAEDALRGSEDRIRLIIDTIPMMAWSLGPDGVLDYVNQRWLDYTGLSLEKAIEEPTGTVHPEDLSRALEKWLVVKPTSEAYEAEMRLQRADGEYRWFLIRIAPLLDEQGNVLKRYGASIDIEDRKRVEEALKESQRKLEEAQRIAHVGHWDRNLETGRITWSDEMYRILGLPLEERDSPRTEWLDIVHPEDRQWVSLALEEMQRRIRRFDVEFRIVRPNGEVRFIHSQGDVICDERGRPLRRFGTAQDITERRRAEEELRKDKEILGKVFDNIPVMISLVGEDSVRLVNPEWERTIGWTLKELQEQNVDIFAEAYPDLSYRQEVLDFVAASTGEWADLKIRARDGRVIDAACAVVRLSDGTRLAIAQDITERKQAEDALRRSEDRLRLVIDTIPTMAWSLQPEGAIDFVNQRWMDYTGLSLEEAIAEPTRTMHSEDLPGAMAEWGANMAAEEPFEDEMRLRRADGEYRWFLVRTDPLRDEQGNLVKWYGVAIDIEDRKRAEEKFKQTSDQLRALSARLQTAREEESKRIAREIHDELGGVLTSWKWDLEEIREIVSDPMDSSQVAALRIRIQAMMKLTETTLNTVRRLASELRPVALELGLVEAIEWQARQFENRSGIAVQLDCSLDKVDLNNEQSTAVVRILQEALTNILRHAQATKVTIMMKQESSRVLLTIKDNGRGITNTEKLDSQSLGLLGMEERAHLVDGEISIEGAKGEGTEITVRVPISAGAG